MICRCSTAGKSSRGFLEKTLDSLEDAFDYAGAADSLARNGGFLQRLDPRVKVCGIMALLIVAIAARGVAGTITVFGIALALAQASRVPWRLLAGRAWLAVFLFTGVIAFPAIFMTPGHALWRVPWFDWPVTDHGLLAAFRLVLRAGTAATLALLLVLCTPWPHVLKALRVFRVPVILVVILGMTHRYIFLLLHLSRDLLEARRARVIGTPSGADARRLAAANAGVLLGKSLQLSGDVFTAMQARGFRGEAHTLDDFRMGARDWGALAGFVAAAALAFWMGAR